MTFDDRVIAFAARFLSRRTFEFVVAPAVADLQFEDSARGWRRAANRLAVLRAVAGGMRDDLARASGRLLLLTLVPASYYIFLLVICYDALSLRFSGNFLVPAMLILLLSCAPVIACCWPERDDAPTVD